MKPFETVPKQGSNNGSALPASCRIRPHSILGGAKGGRKSLSPNKMQSSNNSSAFPSSSTILQKPAAAAGNSSTNKSSSPTKAGIGPVRPSGHIPPPLPQSTSAAARSSAPAGAPTAVGGGASPTKVGHGTLLLSNSPSKDMASSSSPLFVEHSQQLTPVPTLSVSQQQLSTTPTLNVVDVSTALTIGDVSMSLIKEPGSDLSSCFEGVKVRDYIIPVTDLKLAVQQSELEYPDVQVRQPVLTIPHGATGVVTFSIATSIDCDFFPGAIGFEIVGVDDTFFSTLPMLDNSGTLSFHLEDHTTGRKGNTTITFKAVDYSEYFPSTGRFKESAIQTITLQFAAVPIAKRRLVGELQRSQKMLQEEQQQSAAVTPSEIFPQLSTSAGVESRIMNQTSTMGSTATTSGSKPKSRGIQPLCIQTFRREPSRISPIIIANNFVRCQPLSLLKMCTFSVERELLSATSAKESEAPGLLESIRSAMDLRTPVDAIIPMLDKASRLHFSMGGASNLETAMKLALLRIQLMSAALSIDLEAENLDSLVALRLASAKGQTVQLYIRVLVEGAHLFKFMNRFNEALKFYRLATTVTTIGNKTGTKKGASLVPFFVATGDVHVMSGNHTAALDCYERARAFAEMSGGGTVLAECEDLIAIANTLLENFDEAQQALQRSLKIRKEVNNTWSMAETYMVQSYCHFMKDGKEQALQFALQAIDLLEDERTMHTAGSPTKSVAGTVTPPVISSTASSSTTALLLKTVAYTLCGWVQIGKVVSADVKSLFQAAIANCVKVCGQHCWEAALPTWLAEAYDEQDNTRIEVIKGVYAHYAGEDGIQAAAMSLSSAVYLRAKSHHSDIAAKEECVSVLDAASNTLESKLMETVGGGLLQLVAEAQASIHLHFREYTKASVALSRVFALWHASLPHFKHNETLPFRLCSLAAAIYSEGVSSGELRPSPVVAEDASRGVELSGTVGIVSSIVDPLVEEGVDAMLHIRSAGNQEFTAKVVPLILDMAEVEFCKGDYPTSLELFGKALRITDNRNLLYLLGALYKPTNLLTVSECADRNRLLAERSMSTQGIEQLAVLMLQIAVVHEKANDLPQATAIYQRCYATVEMGKLEGHPVAIEALTGVARTLMAQGELGDALVYVKLGHDIFFTHHYQCGEFKKNELVVEVRDNALRTERTLMEEMRARNYLLVDHPYGHPNAQAHILA